MTLSNTARWYCLLQRVNSSIITFETGFPFEMETHSVVISEFFNEFRNSYVVRSALFASYSVHYCTSTYLSKCCAVNKLIWQKMSYRSLQISLFNLIFSSCWVCKLFECKTAMCSWGWFKTNWLKCCVGCRENRATIMISAGHYKWMIEWWWPLTSYWSDRPNVIVNENILLFV